MTVLQRDANGNPYRHIAEMAWADSEDGEADAHLIAAAPDLYAALGELWARTIVGTDAERHAALDKAWAALAKALPTDLAQEPSV